MDMGPKQHSFRRPKIRNSYEDEENPSNESASKMGEVKLIKIKSSEDTMFI